ncbi:lantibiotic dehydratase [Archangium lipolyticum]|uniref:lantibiotic dehydratase n=1 Tax=Archangium lipolyticum TaxID=2970465 RepID=UPI0027D4778B|nr:lantibiotic dehydratase [Archangium lipolyticum]
MKGWSVFPHLVVRTTGFSFERLERLRCPEAAASARKLWAARRELEGLKASGPRLRRPPPGVLAALKAGRPVEVEGLESPESFAAYNTLARAAQEAASSFETAFTRELAGVEASLAALRTEPRFLEAVASSSPPVARDLLAGREGARLKRQVASYLQRLCAKNETMSFFGPINYGRVEPDAPTGVSVRWSGPELLVGRNTFAASWLVLGLVRAIAADPEVAPWLVLRRKSFAVLPPRKGPAPPAASVEDVLPRLMEAVDGTRPLSALREALGVEWPLLLECVHFGLQRNLLTHQLEVPAASHHPLEDLTERLAGIPGPVARDHLRELEGLLRLMARYGAADAAGKMALNEEMAKRARERWSVAPPAPASSGDSHNFYQDRLPMREECGGDLRLTVGGERARELTRKLEPALGLMAEAALRTREAARAAVAALVGARTVPFWKVVAAYGDRPLPYDTTVAAALAAALPDPAASRVELEPSALPTPREDVDLPIVTSIDLLIGASDVEAWSRGDYELVVGDVHDTALVWGWALQFHEERRRVESEMVRALGALRRPVPFVTVLASRRTGLLPSEFPGPVVELGGVSARASGWRLPFDDLQVESDGRTARLLSTRLGSEVCLYNGEMESLVQTAFALPRIRPLRVSLGAHTPRVVLGGAVLQREQWRLEAEDRDALLACKDDRARLQTAVGIWARRGLPDHVFAKFPGERKPVLIDVRSPALLRVFVNLLEQKGEVMVSEMLPAPGQLWLDAAGGRHTAELRCCFLWGTEARG